MYTCISYVLLCNKLSPKLSVENNKYLLPYFFKGHEFGFGLVGWFWLRVSHEITVKMLTRTGVFEDLTGTGGSASKMAHSCLLAEDLSPSLHGPCELFHGAS